MRFCIPKHFGTRLPNSKSTQHRSKLALLVLCSVLAGVACTSSASAQAPSTHAAPEALQLQLQSIRQDAMTAWQKKDADKLKSIFAPDFLFTSPQGITGRDGWLAGLPHCSLDSYTMSNVQAHSLSADAATLHYLLHYVGNCDGKPIPPDTLLTDTFVRRHGKWLIVETSFMPKM